MTWCFWRRRRLVVALLAFFGFFNVYALRVNLSVAVVAMTEPVETKLDNGTVIPEFDWSSQTKGLVLSSFFYGYLITQLPGGWLAAKIGVWSRWAPGPERARLATFAFSGSYAGTVVSMPICSLLAHYTGWPGIFYVFGLSGLIWTTIWWLVVKESPEKDPHISPAELKYIQDSRGTQAVEGSKIRHPWGAMLKSAPVWAIVMAHFNVFKFKTSQTGWLSAVPYLAMAIVLQVAGHIADWLLRRGIMSRTNIRKLFNCGAFLSQTVFMIAAAYSTTVTGCIVFLTIAVGLGGFAWSGFSAIYLIGAIIYGIFCSAEIQPWVVEIDTDASFDTDGASVTTSRGYDNKGLDQNSEM
ncbi:hypothetical protein HF086_014839 [Spodoptera exigua]|uniref:Uncharacterized protein n=1 Tax=Spodoptera exigua TaxID=7107 RepID=A0A922M392_SPOEX|nr:hypothetical protein HF086_014839 [Spodoptera exigua]